ncbi:transposase family protein [Streptomyces sp. NPDC002144]
MPQCAGDAPSRVAGRRRVVAPHLKAVRVERVWAEAGTVHVAARTCELRVACPDCGHRSARVHSRYSRTLADVAVGGWPVLIRLVVLRLFCDGRLRLVRGRLRHTAGGCASCPAS